MWIESNQAPQLRSRDVDHVGPCQVARDLRGESQLHLSRGRLGERARHSGGGSVRIVIISLGGDTTTRRSRRHTRVRIESIGNAPESKLLQFNTIQWHLQLLQDGGDSWTLERDCFLVV